MKLFQTDLRAFHGDSAIKQKYLDRVKWHQEQDNFIQGPFYDNGKGCAVGCTLDFNDKGYGWHKAYEIELGIHQIIAKLEDGIFEELTIEESKAWPYEFLDAIPVGADLSQVWPKFAIWLLIDDQYGVINFARQADKPIIQHIADLYQSENATEEDFINTADAALAASHAADTYAYAAHTAKAAASAIYAAAYVAATALADAGAAARASYATARAADANSAAAYAAAADAVCAGAYTNKDKDVILAQKNKLLELLKSSSTEQGDY